MPIRILISFLTGYKQFQAFYAVIIGHSFSSILVSAV
jgi:hypothetical protein